MPDLDFDYEITKTLEQESKRENDKEKKIKPTRSYELDGPELMAAPPASGDERIGGLFDKCKEILKTFQDQGLHPNVLKDFNNNLINYSDASPMGPILYWCNPEGGFPQEVLAEMNKIESKGAKVYHVTHEFTNFGECWDFLMLTPEDDERSIQSAKEGYCFGYTYNSSHPELSEYGSIAVEVSPSGGLNRVF